MVAGQGNFRASGDAICFFGEMKETSESAHFRGLRTVIYSAPDLEQAKAWYTSVLGVAPYFDRPFYVGYNVGGYELGLDPDGKVATAANPGALVYWGVDNARASFDRLLALGAKERTAPQEVGEGIQVATVFDPFGNVFGIIENPHFAIAEGQE